MGIYKWATGKLYFTEFLFQTWLWTQKQDDSYQGPFSGSCLEKAQNVLSQSQVRLLQQPALWLAEHSLSLLWAIDRKRAQIWAGHVP